MGHRISIKTFHFKYWVIDSLGIKRIGIFVTNIKWFIPLLICIFNFRKFSQQTKVKTCWIKDSDLGEKIETPSCFRKKTKLLYLYERIGNLSNSSPNSSSELNVLTWKVTMLPANSICTWFILAKIGHIQPITYSKIFSR